MDWFNGVGGNNSGLSWYNPPKEEIKITEMCDICGKDIPLEQVWRTPFVSATGTKYVIRHHPYCDIHYLTQYL